MNTARLHSLAACAPADAPTSATTTDAPSSENSTAASRPMPPAAPVITATLPSRRPILMSALRRDEHVLDLGITVETVHAELASESGLLEPAKRRRHAHRGIAVDGEDSRVERASDAQGTSAVGR